MPIYKLEGAVKDYVWGGTRLMTEYHKKIDSTRLAESWELSTHPDGPSRVTNLPGVTLESLPIIVKLIDAKESLSVQVHPTDPVISKTEFWYIVDAQPGAFIYYGFERPVTKEEFRRGIEENTLLNLLHKQPVKPGEEYFIPAGTIHAIGAGILIAEVQQCSNVTYRVYDYNRGRELHVAQALECTCLEPVKDYDFAGHLCCCEYFTLDWVDAPLEKVREEGYTHWLCLEGSGTMQCGSQTEEYQKGDSLLVPPNSEVLRVEGTGEFLKTVF